MAGDQKALYDLTPLLKTYDNDQKAVRDMVRMFLDTIPPQWEELKDDYRTGKFEEVSTLAHSIKPVMDIMHIEMLTGVIREIEKLAKEEKNEELKSLIDNFDDVIIKVFNSLRDDLENRFI
ncbi:MAG TPA: Hpt domain-containing protein [Bacteroidales bacterium]|nr:Hpt domain-containing protein [Bacteroidales bacterium]